MTFVGTCYGYALTIFALWWTKPKPEVFIQLVELHEKTADLAYDVDLTDSYAEGDSVTFEGIKKENSHKVFLKCRFDPDAKKATISFTVRAATLEDVWIAATLPKVQYFGVRLDTLVKTSPFHLAEFVNDALILQRYKQRLDDALTILALILRSGGMRLSPDLQRAVNNASANLVATSNLYGRDRASLRRRVDILLQPAVVSSSYLHRRESKRLNELRSLLSDLYRELLG